MAEEFKIGTGYVSANGKFSSSNLHIHKERRMLMLTVLVDAAHLLGDGAKIIMDRSEFISH